MQTLLLHTRNSALSRHSVWLSPLLRASALAIAVGVAYFLVARLSLALLTKPDGVAVFWPAAGIAAGTLIALGFTARLPVVLGVMTATIAANLLGDRNLAAGLVFALCNAGESLLVAWLITRHFGESFRLERLRSVLGFFVAASLGPAISGIAATVGFVQFHSSDAPVLITWLNWFVSDALGIIMVAPLLIGLGALRHDLPERWELCEGAVTLAALAVVTAIAFGAPAQYWYTVLPLGLLLPVLLAAHCRPVFAAAAALVLGFAVVWTTTFTMDDLGELPSLHDRAFAGRATLLAIATCTLMLAALFAERRQKEKALEASNVRLKDSNGRLQLALDGAELGTWSLDLESGRFENDVRDRQINGHDLDGPPLTLAQARSQIHPDDLSSLDAAFTRSGRAGGRCRTEYRLAPRTDQEGSDRERWVAIEGAVVHRADGRPVQLLGVTRDITERKQAKQMLAERNVQLALAGKFALVGTFTFDVNLERMQVSPGYAAIHGLPEGTEEISRDDWRRGVHPEDLPGVEARFGQAMADRRREHYCEYRIVRSSGEIRWIDSRSLISYDPVGAARLVGANIDITQRKQTEAALAGHKASLADALAAGQVMAFDWDAATGQSRRSDNAALILAIGRDRGDSWPCNKFLRCVHPDDRHSVKTRIRQLSPSNPSYALTFRFCPPNGEQVWLEETAKGEFDAAGRLQRIKGLTRNITQRKKAELVLEERNVQLALAAKTGLVGSYAYDTDIEIMQISAGYAAIHGFPEGTTEIARSECLAGVHPDDVGRVEQFRSVAFRERRREYNVEYRIIRPSGELRWVETRCFIFFSGGGHPQRVVGVSIDITERKRAVDKLQASERKLRHLLGALPAAIYVTDTAGHITYCNHSAVDLWGTEPVLGKDKWSDLVKFYHADGSPMALADCPTEVALKHGRIVREQEAIIERKDGSRIPIIPYPTPLRDETGTIVGVVNMTVDISERKKAELILADQTAQLALAGKAALVGSFAYDVDKEWMQVSEGYAAIHGFPDGTTEVARSEWQLGLHPEDRIRLEKIRSRCFRERLTEYDVDYRIVRSEGEVRWIDARCFVSYHGDGHPKRVVGVNIDITARKRAEEHLKAMNAELDHRVKNVLATAIAVATQTLNASGSSEQFVSAFDGRLRSMAQTHELLSERLWRGIPLAELILRELEPYADGNNTEICGPEVILTAEAGQTLAMVFHELATNAAKHGAFSSPEGKVSVDWRRQLNGDASGGLVIEWRETGGPPAKAECKASYGISVIRELIPHELAGKVDHVLMPEGVRCQLAIPGRWIDASSPVERTFNQRHEEAVG